MDTRKLLYIYVPYHLHANMPIGTCIIASPAAAGRSPAGASLKFHANNLHAPSEGGLALDMISSPNHHMTLVYLIYV